MAIHFNNIGLTEKQIENLIDRELDSNADLLIGIDDPEVQEMMSVLKKAIAVAISENNKQIQSDIEGKQH